MKTSSSFWTIVIALLLVCCCLTWLIAVGTFALMVADQPSNVGSVPPTDTPRIPVVTPLPPAATDPGSAPTNPYNRIVPTPTGAAFKYPVTYDTKFTLIKYPVNGKTLNEIAKSLNASALTDPHEPGSRYYARTDWYLAARWRSASTARGCEVDTAQVSIVVTITVPVLATSGVPMDVQKQWDIFLDNAITHENGHVKIAYDGARDYQNQLGNYAPAANCDRLQTQLQDLFRRNYDQLDRANVDYDAKTKHGETQGAVFP